METSEGSWREKFLVGFTYLGRRGLVTAWRESAVDVPHGIGHAWRVSVPASSCAPALVWFSSVAHSVISAAANGRADYCAASVGSRLIYTMCEHAIHRRSCCL